MSKSLQINPVFANRLRPLTNDEMAALKANLLRDGCINPIVTWNGVIVDGHNRYDICQSFDIDYRTKPMKFASEDAALAWIDMNQDGRRNETEEERKYRIGKAYNERKVSTIDRAAAGGNAKAAKGHGDPKQNTAVVVGDEYGVSEKTVKRYGKFAEAVDELKPKQRDAILTGSKEPLPKDDGKSQVEQILNRLKQGPATTNQLASIAPNHTCNITNLRKKGHNIVCSGGLYELLDGTYKAENKPSRNGRQKTKESTPEGQKIRREFYERAKKLSDGGYYNYDDIRRVIKRKSKNDAKLFVDQCELCEHVTVLRYTSNRVKTFQFSFDDRPFIAEVRELARRIAKYPHSSREQVEDANKILSRLPEEK